MKRRVRGVRGLKEDHPSSVKNQRTLGRRSSEVDEVRRHEWREERDMTRDPLE